MKIIRSLLVYYSLFLVVAPVVRIAGHLTHFEFISLTDYLWIVIFFVAALVIYAAYGKEKPG